MYTSYKGRYVTFYNNITCHSRYSSMICYGNDHYIQVFVTVVRLLQ